MPCVIAFPCLSTSVPLSYVWAFGFVGCILFNFPNRKSTTWGIYREYVLNLGPLSTKQPTQFSPKFFKIEVAHFLGDKFSVNHLQFPVENQHFIFFCNRPRFPQCNKLKEIALTLRLIPNMTSLRFGFYHELTPTGRLIFFKGRSSRWKMCSEKNMTTCISPVWCLSHVRKCCQYYLFRMTIYSTAVK